jgi:hypothetical protein
MTVNRKVAEQLATAKINGTSDALTLFSNLMICLKMGDSIADASADRFLRLIDSRRDYSGGLELSEQCAMAARRLLLDALTVYAKNHDFRAQVMAEARQLDQMEKALKRADTERLESARRLKHSRKDKAFQSIMESLAKGSR